MNDPLEPLLNESALKLCRAKYHLDSLNSLVEEFINCKPYSFRVDPHPQPPDYVIRAYINRAVPKHLGLVIGDFAHNARSALDYLIFQISSLADSDPKRRRLQFPIFTSPEDYVSRVNAYLAGIDTAKNGIIETLQPYHRGGGADGDALAILSEINNADKHRLLTVIGATGANPKISIDQPQSNVGRLNMTGGTVHFSNYSLTMSNNRAITEDGAIVGRLRLIRESKIDMEPDLEIQIQFGKGHSATEGKPILETLSFILDHVKEIIERF